jgi:RimJ/RimL family protein N-acetyltransferase/ketosteroid isomerase-like protein
MPPSPQPTLVTTRLVLRPAQAADADALWALWRDPGVRRYLWDDRAIARDEAVATLDDCLALAPQGLGLWLVAPRDRPAQPIGCAGLLPVGAAAEHEPRLAGMTEALVALAPDAWGRGHATEALVALQAHAARTLRLPRLAAVTDVPNAASDRMLRRAGFTVLGESTGPRHPLRTYLWTPGAATLPTHVQGDGFLLRPWREGDRAALLRHADDPDVARNLRLLPHPYDDAAADAWLAHAAADPPPRGIWAIDVAGEAVGCLALERGADVEASSYEIGYWLGRSHWGRGLATAAVRLATELAWMDPAVARVQAGVFAWNAASMRVLEKAGYAREAVLVRAGSRDGIVFDRVVHARTRDTGLPYVPFRPTPHPVPPMIDPEIAALEEELRAAQLAADVAALDRLIDDDLLFTGPDGRLATKAEDLAAHGEGVVRFVSHEPEELRVRRVGTDVAVAALRTRLAVRVAGQMVAGTYRYTRVWERRDGRWRIVGGHVSPVPDADASPAG